MDIFSMFQSVVQLNTVEDLVYHLLNEIGLGINEQGFVYDQSTEKEILFQGKQIKASINPLYPAIPNDLYSIFDPVFDGKFMSMMLGYYLKKCEANGDLNPLSIADQTLDPAPHMIANPVKTKKTRVAVICEPRKEYVSEYYYQKGLKYSDMILRLGGLSICNLWMFDSIPEEPIQQTQVIIKSANDTKRRINSGGTAEQNIQDIQKKYDNEKHWVGKEGTTINYWD